MPGPGGGSRGGGGGRGFGGGGSFGGGRGGNFGGGGRGFGGGHHHGYHHHGPHYHGGWFFGPRRYYGGGGCLGGMLGLLIAPIILIAFAGIMLLTTFSSAFNSITTGGEIYYNEEIMQDYANQVYAQEFGGEADYEDALVIVFLVEDVNYYEYAYIAWPGDHIDQKINYMFGAEGTKFGNAIANSAINSNSYKYSLDSGIAAVMTTMQGHITALGLNSNLICDSETSQYKSHLINKSRVDMTEATVNTALENFTAATGIPVAVVVEDADEVLPKQFDYLSVIIAVIFIVVAVILIIKALKNRKSKNDDDGSYKGSQSQNSGYNNNNNNYNNYNNSGW